MIAIDIIVHIDNFTNNKNIELLDKEIGGRIILSRNARLWDYIYWNIYNINNSINLKELWISSVQTNFLYTDNTDGRSTDLEIKSKKIKYIPREMEKLINLVELSLVYLHITEFPKEIGKLINLKKLRLNNNKIEKIPEEICNLINLKLLCLDCNRIRKISAGLSNLKNLKKLFFCDNQITYLPKEFGRLINLKKIAFCRNQIKEIPREILELVNLTIYM